MFTKSAQFYDALYDWKDYEAEARQLHERIQALKQSDGDTLLDVACGTGVHDVFLSAHYDVEGIDLDEKMLDIARERLPDITFYAGDMTSFELNKQYDVVICMFSSVGYVKTVEAMRQAIANFARHTKPGGVVVVEPWFAPGKMTPGWLSVKTAETGDIKICRMSRTKLEPTVSTLYFDYMVGTPDAVHYFVEVHELGLFTPEEQLAAFRDAGLDVTHDPDGFTDRGLFIGTKPLA